MLLLVAAFVVAMSWSEEDILFPTHVVGPPEPLPPSAGRLSLDVPSGERLHGVHIPPAAPASETRTLVLGFGGNAWNGDDVATYLHEAFPAAHVVAFHYRGYRPSTGRPSAQTLIADAPLVFDAAFDRVNPHRVIAVGFSIGSGIASSLAGRRDLDGLILVTPFDSMKAVARHLYPWIPVGLRNEIDTVGMLEGSNVPVAILAAQGDEIVPASRTEALRERVPNLVYDRTISGAGHNDIYVRADFRQAMNEALEAVTK